ncbi:hypothetical protein GCM10012285_27620 [Streptomyces kronopolitis]|uniref:Uncharacterized protein n=1 Tax=Streptomyces kronopolitis TaxID=1612435 RepID=A0ABQ2JCK9_9ACTN|nr:hypothetical protein GCM10012285_27620 [Streptomyces kronopolitis]
MTIPRSKMSSITSYNVPARGGQAISPAEVVEVIAGVLFVVGQAVALWAGIGHVSGGGSLPAAEEAYAELCPHQHSVQGAGERTLSGTDRGPAARCRGCWKTRRRSPSRGVGGDVLAMGRWNLVWVVWDAQQLAGVESMSLMSAELPAQVSKGQLQKAQSGTFLLTRGERPER